MPGRHGAAADAERRARRARAALQESERVGREAAARAAEAAAASAAHDLEQRERHAAFEARARDLAPALAQLRAELEAAQERARWSEKEIAEWTALHEKCKDMLGMRERAAATKDKEIQYLQEALAASVTLHKEEKQRALAAKKEATKAVAALQDKVRILSMWDKVGEPRAVVRPAAAPDGRKRSVAQAWAQRLRKRLRLR